MNFQQLRFVREAVRQNMNLTEVANVLYTSQSGVSKQIKDLEDELGVDIFIRRGKRLTGLTEPGKAIYQLISLNYLCYDPTKPRCEAEITSSALGRLSHGPLTSA